MPDTNDAKVYLHLEEHKGKIVLKTRKPVEVPAPGPYWMNIYKNEKKTEDWHADYYGYLKPAPPKQEVAPTPQPQTSMDIPF